MRSATAGFNRLFSNPAFLTIWAMTAAFGSYFCVYGLRKPFTAAGFAANGEGAAALEGYPRDFIISRLSEIPEILGL